MSLNSHLENLRSKPEHIRHRIALGSSFGITLIIFAFWLGSFSATGPSTSSSVADTIDKINTPAQSLVAAAGSFFDSIRDKIFGAKKIEFSTVEIIPGDK